MAKIVCVNFSLQDQKKHCIKHFRYKIYTLSENMSNMILLSSLVVCGGAAFL